MTRRRARTSSLIAAALALAAVLPASGCFTLAAGLQVNEVARQHSPNHEKAVTTVAMVPLAPVTVALDLATAPIQLPLWLLFFSEGGFYPGLH